MVRAAPRLRVSVSVLAAGAAVAGLRALPRVRYRARRRRNPAAAAVRRSHYGRRHTTLNCCTVRRCQRSPLDVRRTRT